MCHQELWLTSASHPLSYLNSSLDFARGRITRKFTAPIFRHVLQIFAIPGCFSYNLFCSNPFSLLSTGWFVIVKCDTASTRDIFKWLLFGVNERRVDASNDLLVALTLILCLFCISFFLEIIITCRWGVNYVREDNDTIFCQLLRIHSGRTRIAFRLHIAVQSMMCMNIRIPYGQ